MKNVKFLLVVIVIFVLMLSCSKKTTEPDSTVAKPSFSPTGGTYTSPQLVTISCATLGVTIIYTKDGSEPTSGSMVYTNPILISTTTTIKAKAFRTGMTDSKIANATITINFPAGFVLVPGGTFIMGDTRDQGDSDEMPTHSVTLNSFYISKYEVTQSDWQAVMGSNPAHDYGVGAKYPVYNVSWYNIIKYCNLKSMSELLTPVYTINNTTNPVNWGATPTSGNTTWDAVVCNWSANGYRLLTEAEWEFASRGGQSIPDYLYSGSDDITDVAWFYGNIIYSFWGTKPVGGKTANGLGIYDMSGNVWEWCWDWYSSSYYNSNSVNNPTGPDSGISRLVRGGDWGRGASSCRVSKRGNDFPYFSNSIIGFRLCRAN